MDQSRKLELKRLACRARMGIVEGVYQAKSGHPGGSLSAVDLLTYLYFERMRVDPANPKWEDRDRFVLSKGHAAPALYAVLALRGFFPEEELKTLRKNGSRLQGHPSMRLCPGVDMSTGSLGQGFSAAGGMALGAKLAGRDITTYALLGDGEIQEGQVWEAAMFAAAKGLDRLVAIVDNNDLQIDGTVGEVNSPYPINEKFAAFGWNVLEICAHCFTEMEEAFRRASERNGKPTAIIMKSVKGKGVSFMENQVGWHGVAPNAEQYAQAMAELEARLAELEGRAQNG
ncbi:MAG: transketolase [Oscillospiraceae bacterium]|nr:transketolase [Oscillospiraceae bacterium]